MDSPTREGRRETMRTAFGPSRVLDHVAHTRRARLTKRGETPHTVLPKSPIGPVLQRVAELSPACSSSKDMTDTSLSRLRLLPEFSSVECMTDTDSSRVTWLPANSAVEAIRWAVGALNRPTSSFVMYGSSATVLGGMSLTVITC
jgi:hypothetical protein